MKLDIVHQLPGGRQWFSAGDTVRGCVVLDTPRNEQILSVVVTLHGQLPYLLARYVQSATQKQLTSLLARENKSVVRSEPRRLQPSPVLGNFHNTCRASGNSFTRLNGSHANF